MYFLISLRSFYNKTKNKLISRYKKLIYKIHKKPKLFGIICCLFCLIIISFIFYNKNVIITKYKSFFSAQSNNSHYNSDFINPIVFNDKLYFLGNSKNNTKSLYYFDKKSKLNTVKLNIINNSFNFINPIIYKNKIYFGSDGNSEISCKKIYCFDGKKITPIKSNSSQGFIEPTICNNILYYISYGSSKECQINVIKENNTTTLISEGMNEDIKFSNIFSINNKLFYTKTIIKTNESNLFELNKNVIRSPYINDFVSDTKVTFLDNNDLYIFDNTKQNIYKGISKVSSINKSNSSYKDGFNLPTKYFDSIVFSGFNDTCEKIYLLDKNKIININSSNSDYSHSYKNPIVLNNSLYFEGVSINGISKMYKFDGNEILNVQLTKGCDYLYGFENPILYNDAIVFIGNNINTKKSYSFDGKYMNKLSFSTSDYLGVYNTTIVFNNLIYFNGLTSKSSSEEIYKVFAVETK